MWERVRLLIFNSKKASISFFILLLIIGMATASIVNWISVTPVFAKSFYLGFFVAGTMIILGVILVEPFFTFRFKYKFLDEFDDPTAQVIHKLKRKAESRLKSTDGIIGIRLFRIERHTIAEDSLYEFNMVFDVRSKYAKINKLTPTKIKVPIVLDEWIQKNIIANINNVNVGYDINKLNQMKMDKYTAQMFFYYFNNYYREKYEGENNQWYEQNISEAIGKWKVKIQKKKLFKSVHYSTVFYKVPSLNIFIKNAKTVHIEKINSNNIYMEDYINTHKEKQHRRYVDLHFKLICEAEGDFDFILHTIIDKRVIPSEDHILLMLDSLLQ
ncbi:hypothetical protein [Sporosarcina obsidiansis]|uniref:hypothetical protein n=1 Tax=Sporosarcina obsidiansis TaxID=2660748 RepID=UPI00129B3A2D|nr:hypothetical protein [Sporosarcina obsidiansis]